MVSTWYPLAAQVGAHLGGEAALRVENNVGAARLEQVGLEVVAGLAAARAAQDEHVVVEARLHESSGEVRLAVRMRSPAWAERSSEVVAMVLIMVVLAICVTCTRWCLCW